jgi:hypothetical protein
MSDLQLGIVVCTLMVLAVAGFIWYWRSTEWVTSKKNSSDPQRYCTRCGTVAEPEYQYAGSLLIEILLLLLFIVPAIFYHFWRKSREYWGCPSCKSGEIIRLDSPIAMRQLGDPLLRKGAQ